ncbi:MAG: hypothetical protein WEA09_15240 [Gemmatimonadota bacterium]
MKSQRSRVAMRRRHLVAGAVALTGIWSCGGDNVFAPGDETPPRVIELVVPAQIRSGQTMDVRVRAQGSVQIQGITVRVRGAHTADVTLQPSNPRSEVVVDFTFPLPEIITDTILTVAATATDARGNVSQVVTRTVRAVDITPPGVTATLGNATVGLGKEASLRVQATDNVGLSSVGFRAFILGGDTIASRFVAINGALPVLQKDTTFFFTVPQNLDVDSLRVEGVAVDRDGNTTSAEAGTPLRVIFIDEEAPRVRIREPVQGVPPHPVGDSLFVRVEITDNGLLDSLNFRAFGKRGSLDLGTYQEVARYEPLPVSLTSQPSDTTITRFLFPVVGETQGEEILVEVRAIDGQGNVGKDSVRVALISDNDPPHVSITAPTAGATLPVGDSVQIQAVLTDTIGFVKSGVRRAVFSGVAVRGDASLGTQVVVQRFSPREVEFDPATRNQAVSRFVLPTPDSTAENVLLIVQADDDAGNMGADTIQVALARQDQPPLVEILSPARMFSRHQVGDSIIVQARVQPATGVAASTIEEVTFEGVAFRGDPNLGTFVEVPRFNPIVVPGDEISGELLTRILRPTSESGEEDVHLIVTALDNWGNEGADTIAVGLFVDDLPPLIEILAPQPGAGVPVGDSVFVEVNLTDPIREGQISQTGLASVTLEGVAFRGSEALGTREEIQKFEAKTVNFVPPVATANVTRYLLASSNQDTEGAFIRITARDVQGNVTRDSVNIFVGGPKVEILNLISGQQVQAGQNVQVDTRSADPLGIQNVTLEVTGAFTTSIPFNPGGSPTLVEHTFTLPIPAGTTGTIQVTARALSGQGIVGVSPTLTVNVVPAGAIDNVPPIVGVTAVPQGPPFSPNRLEKTDSITVIVTGRDESGGSGVRGAGYTMVATNRVTGATATSSVVVDPIPGAPVAGQAQRTFNVPVDAFDAIISPTARPDTLDIQVYGFMVDAANNCGATNTQAEQSLACSPAGGGAGTTAAGVSGLALTVFVVSGQTVLLPNNAVIADAVVDPTRQELFLSNIRSSRVERFDLATRTFLPNILVGSDPWGLFWSDRATSTLFVANSGGTNISLVDLNSYTETLADRVLTPNSVLWEVVEGTGDSGQLQWTINFFDYSDRPQFLAVGTTGNYVYSTKPTGSAPDGTIRVADVNLGPDPEVVIFTDHGGPLLTGTSTTALNNVDDIDLATVGGQPGLTVVDHQPGNFGVPVTGEASGVNAAFFAAVDLEGNYVPGGQLGEVEYGNGVWNRDAIGLRDTTFVAASGDGEFVLIGEGNTANAGRVMMYTDASTSVSSNTRVVDLVNNSSERVRGIDLNYDGTLGAYRGEFAVYFFDRGLRLQGSPPSSGGSGVALHPLHNSGPLGTEANVALAFVGAGDGVIEVFDTRSFSRIGRVFHRNTVTGPMKATLPFPGDNTGLTCGTQTIAGAGSGSAIDWNSGATDDACIVVKLSLVTADGGVAVVNVTKADIIRDL